MGSKVELKKCQSPISALWFWWLHSMHGMHIVCKKKKVASKENWTRKIEWTFTCEVDGLKFFNFSTCRMHLDLNIFVDSISDYPCEHRKLFYILLFHSEFLQRLRHAIQEQQGAQQQRIIWTAQLYSKFKILIMRFLENLKQ